MSFSLFPSFNPLLATLNNIPQTNDPVKNKSSPSKQPNIHILPGNAFFSKNQSSISTLSNSSISEDSNPNLYIGDDVVHFGHISSCFAFFGFKQKDGISYYGYEGSVKSRILKDVLREMGDINYGWECLEVIDATQRLGIDYHFKEEIEAVLHSQYHLFKSRTHHYHHHHDLHKTALLFRLFRQQGYLVSADVFESFMDKKGKFKEEVREDIKGLTSLYEASKLCMELHGDDEILEEAQKFSSHWLNARAEHHHDLANFVHNTLAYPHHTSVAQFMVPNYLGEDMKSPNKWIHIFQHAAKMELYSNQRLRQNEITQFLKWWKESNLGKELEFGRDEPIKWYTASMVCITDSLSSKQRLQLAKSISFIYLIDDIFDVFGTLQQLTLFTQAIQRWDLGAAEGLPNCMIICLEALFDVTEEISYNIYQTHGWNPIHFLQKAWAKLCNAFLVEAEWFNSGHSPSADEYLKNGIVSTGVHVTLIHVFFLLGQQINQETAQLFDEDLDIVSSTATILRLWDDMGSAEDEKQVGNDGSYLEYYMKEHPNISNEEVQQHVMNKICNAWKNLNRECLIIPNQFPPKFTQSCLNVARGVPMAYNYGRNQSIMSLQNLIKNFLFYGMENM